MHAFSAYQLSVKKIWITEKICTSSTSLTKTRYFHFQWCHFSSSHHSINSLLPLLWLVSTKTLYNPSPSLPINIPSSVTLFIRPLLIWRRVHIPHPPTPTLSLRYATGDLTGSLFLITNKSISFQFWYCQIRYIQPN